MTLDGPSDQASCYIERFDDLDLEHVSTVFKEPCSIWYGHLEAYELLLDEYERVLDDISPF